MQDPTPITFQVERELHQKWNFLREIEEIFFRQKSRINWLREGDMNTTYFHRICQTRACYTAIRAFMTGDTWITDPQAMSDHAVNHFRSVLGPHNYQPPQLRSHPDWFADLTGFSFPEHLLQLMLTTPRKKRSSLLSSNRTLTRLRAQTDSLLRSSKPLGISLVLKYWPRSRISLQQTSCLQQPIQQFLF